VSGPVAMAPSTSGSSPDASGAPLIITIDGPAGTGKSTVAARLAAHLGLTHLDTGAMYRAAALLAAERGIDPDDGPAIAAAIREVGIRFDWDAPAPRLLVGGRDPGERIRDLDVGRIVSRVAACPEVRAVLTQWQRQIAHERPRLVTEGRDQGSTVFPDADVRFYLDADTDIRADRRMRQLTDAGRVADRADVREDIRRRDRLDRERSDGPLVLPEGAVVVDTGNRSLEDVLAVMLATVRAVVDADDAEPSSGGATR
jgi:cytidylate kinase